MRVAWSWGPMVGVCLLTAGCAGVGAGGPEDAAPDSAADADADSDADADVDADGDSDSDADSSFDPSCAEEARWIYLVDSGLRLVRFEPDTLSLIIIGWLECPGASEAYATPFSMAVDRQGTAWVLYSNGSIYRVSTEDASCEATSFVPGQHGFELFGMGFATLAEGSTDEELYVAGGSAEQVGSGPNGLATIDTSTFLLSPVGEVPGSPELTGTGLGELWGFFPDTSPPSVRRVDKASGATSASFDVAALATEQPRAWAFAFWGGRFYMFLERLEDSSTGIWRLDPTDGSVTEIFHEIGLEIVGAGVSTCAPYELI